MHGNDGRESFDHRPSSGNNKNCTSVGSETVLLRQVLNSLTTGPALTTIEASIANCSKDRLTTAQLWQFTLPIFVTIIAVTMSLAYVSPSAYSWLLPTSMSPAHLDDMAANGLFPKLADLYPSILFALGFGLLRSILNGVLFTVRAFNSITVSCSSSLLLFCSH